MGHNALSRHERGYGYAWQKVRHSALVRDNYLCQPCYAKGRPTPAQEVDHIKPKADGGTDDLSNLQSICRPCHEAKTKQENTAKPSFRSRWMAFVIKAFALK